VFLFVFCNSKIINIIEIYFKNTLFL